MVHVINNIYKSKEHAYYFYFNSETNDANLKIKNLKIENKGNEIALIKV